MVIGGYSHLLQILAHLTEVLQSNFVYAARFEFGFLQFLPAACNYCKAKYKYLKKNFFLSNPQPFHDFSFYIYIFKGYGK